jgi:hypothetical protein
MKLKTYFWFRVVSLVLLFITFILVVVANIVAHAYGDVATGDSLILTASIIGIPTWISIQIVDYRTTKHGFDPED